ncbi:uncharacterized protein LOC126845188 [Adelges cooleyi]|uniref:uncharacterized protein LOC126845188 n=1 Tax=Adelges cooleyi TaxID=133065 RepID=UPI00217F6A25|nr:uncharacterized protein LOC126845188 [Adelges cooleyi]
MFLKFSLSFLFFILTVSCMHTGQPEGKTEPDALGSAVLEKKSEVTPEDLMLIDEAFVSIRKYVENEYVDHFTDDNIGLFEYYFYMGDNVEEWVFIRSYFESYVQGNMPVYFSISLKKFRDLFKIHCEKLGVPVAKIAEQRKAAMDEKEKNRTDPESKLDDYIFNQSEPMDRSGADF